VAKKVGDYKIPFRNGSPLVYPETWGTDAIEWRDNTPFSADVEFERFTRGRSAARSVWREFRSGVLYEMFLVDLADAMPAVVDGKLSGEFCFQKRGQNYGMRLLEARRPARVETDRRQRERERARAAEGL